MITVCVVTGSRSEYGLLRPLLSDFKKDSNFRLQLIVMGSHFLDQHGYTVKEIEDDGFSIDARVGTDTNFSKITNLCGTMASWISQLGDELSRLKPDLVLIMGDRYELLSVCSACVLMSIPIVHLSGGEVTEGAIDEQIRHAVTKMAHLHFVANEIYGARVRQMGEEPWRVCVSGDPGLDNIKKHKLVNREVLEKYLGVKLSSPVAVVTFHPVTREASNTMFYVQQLLNALSNFDMTYVITYPNVDAGSDIIIREIEEFANKKQNVRLVKNFGRDRYLSLLDVAACMIGNSSSGLVEAPTFNLPVVNIGSRQDGRIKGSNVIDVPCETNAITDGIRKALAYDRKSNCENPYGRGDASLKIREYLHEVFSGREREEILRKRFLSLPNNEPSRHRIGGSFVVDFSGLANPSNQDWRRYFNLNDDCYRVVASGRGAFALAIDELKLDTKKLLVPNYLCGEVQIPILKSRGVAYRYYPVDHNLFPKVDELLEMVTGDVGAVLLINYFGVTDHTALAAKLRAKSPNIKIVLDAAQSLYDLHFLTQQEHWADFVIASFQKFFGIPDGGVLRSKTPIRTIIGPANSEQGVDYLLASAIKSNFLERQLDSKMGNKLENVYLKYFEVAKKHVPVNPVSISALSERLMNCAPFELWMRQRIENYLTLLSAFASHRLVRPLRLDLAKNAIPLTFPVLVVDGQRNALRKFLSENNIYCAVHWPLLPELQNDQNAIVNKFSESVLSLPIDQRYSSADMDVVVRQINKFGGLS